VDISVLRGMKLIELNVTGTKVADLSPLREMWTLETLTLRSTPVLDLSSLRGLRLRKLDLTGCPVSDIAPLRGAPLEKLNLENTRVTDLSPLAGMPLKSIDLSHAPVLDYTPLVGLPLENVILQYNRLNDLSVFRGMPLRELTLWGCTDARNYAVLADIKTLELLLLPIEYRNLPTNDIAAIGALRSHPKLRQIGSDVMNQMGIAATGSKEVFWKDWDREQTFVPALRNSGFRFSLSKLPGETYSLNLDFQPVSDLSILRGAPISELWLSGCKVTDLEPIRDLPLKVLGLYNNPVEGLKPLSKMPLEELLLHKTLVSDLAPLKGLPLKKLYLHECDKLTDISVLVEIPTLESLTVPVYVRDVENLHKLPNLELLAFGDNGQIHSTPNSTAEQFWRDRAANPWLTQLRDSGLKITQLTQRSDRTWEVNLDGSTIGDLTFLRGAPIDTLCIAGTAVTDLEPLRGVAIKSLAIWRTKVTDLGPLKGMKLRYLNLVGIGVTDISVLGDMPLTFLQLDYCTELTDLSPLMAVTTLRYLTLPPNAKNIEFLRAFPKLERISYAENPSSPYLPDRTAAEFWKEYDARKK
jgi:eukaryotic-like serine/threonine-protein kinase